MIDKIIEFNKQFVASKSYEQYITDKCREALGYIAKARA